MPAKLECFHYFGTSAVEAAVYQANTALMIANLRYKMEFLIYKYEHYFTIILFNDFYIAYLLPLVLFKRTIVILILE